MNIKTTQQITDQNIANLESTLNQDTPLNPKAFNRVLSATEAIMFTALTKFGVDRAKAAFVLTATRPDLIILGAEYGISPKVATSSVLTITLPGTNGTIIPATNDFVGDSNGVRYSVDASATVTGGIATISVTSQQVGAVGNLNNGETLTIGSPVAGADSIATVTDTTTVGAEEESTDNFRIRVLDIQRSPGGGGNTADYRNDAQKADGVQRAYPYSAGPTRLSVDLPPPNRTVYIQTTTAIEEDGIPPQSVLDAARASIITDADTGIHNQPLGLTDDTLFVEPISRTPFFVQISGLSVDSTIEATVKSEIETQLTNYFLIVQPFVDGLDAPIDRTDTITDLTVSSVVQSVLTANGGTAQAISFDIVQGGSLPEYILDQGELAKLATGGITYV